MSSYVLECDKVGGLMKMACTKISLFIGAPFDFNLCSIIIRVKINKVKAE